MNRAPEFEDHGADVPPGMPPGPAGAKQYVGGAYKKFPNIHVEIPDLIAEDDKVVVRNHWMGTEAASGTRHEFSAIAIWRIAPIGRAVGVPHAAAASQEIGWR